MKELIKCFGTRRYFQNPHPRLCGPLLHYCTNVNSDRLQKSRIVTDKKHDVTSNKFTPETRTEGKIQMILGNVVNYVEKTTHMQDVREAQSKVMQIKRKLLLAGEEKRALMKKMDDLRDEINHVYKDMKINRSKELYLDLARKEIELCEREKQYSETYKTIDKNEQFLFTEFSSAINDSYEKEKIHTNFIKIISVLGTITCSLIGLVLSIMYHTFQYNNFQNCKSFDNDLLKSINMRLGSVEKAIQNTTCSKESWGSYFRRNTRWVYGWAVKSK